jgi:hypothetical protein
LCAHVDATDDERRALAAVTAQMPHAIESAAAQSSRSGLE